MGQIINLPLPASDPATANLIDDFLSDLIVQGRSPQTIKTYRADLRRLNSYARGSSNHEPRICGVTAPLLRAFMKTQAHLAKATRARRQAAITSFLDWCVRTDHIEANPARKLPPVQRDEPVPKPMKATDIENLLKAIPSEQQRDRVLFTLLAETGMRIGEALGIQVADVDLTPDSELIVVRRPKGNRQRVVVLDGAPRTRKLLRRYLKQKGRKAGWLFEADPSKRGRADRDGPLTYDAARLRWWKYCDAAGVKATIHQLRHSVGTALINDGLPLEVIKRRLGHKNIVMVQNYAALSDEMLRKHLRAWEDARPHSAV